MTGGIETTYKVKVTVPGTPDAEGVFETVLEALPDDSELSVKSEVVDGPDYVVVQCGWCGDADNYAPDEIPEECGECGGPVTTIA